MLTKTICLVFLLGTTTHPEKSQGKAEVGDAMLAQDFNLQGQVGQNMED